MKQGKVKKILGYVSMILAVALLGCVTPSVFAAEPIVLPEDGFISNGKTDVTINVTGSSALTTPSETYYLRSMALGDYSDTEQNVYNTIAAGIRDMKASIVINRNGLSADRIVELFFDAQADYPEYFYCRSGYGASYSDTIFTLNPVYINRANGESDDAYKSKMSGDIEKFNAAVSEAVANVTFGMSELQKVLVLHDYIAVNAEYINDNSEVQYTAYGILVNNQGVCQGYAYAYNLLLKKAGVKSVYVTGKADGGDHGWNKVKIGEAWYNVDVTWDDPSNGVIGESKHNYFLISDSAIGADHTFDSRSGPACNSTHGNAFWLKTETQVACLNGKWYYIDSNDGKFYGYDFASNISTNIFTVDKIWFNSESSYYPGNMSKIAYDKSAIYYNTDSGIYKTDGTGAGTLVYSIEINNYKPIYGIQFMGGELAYELRNAPHIGINEIHKTGILANAASTTIKGDINGDEVIDVLDLILLYKNFGSTDSVYDVAGNGGSCNESDYNALLALIFK